MDIEFHYYITYILARKAGFSKENAYTIAYSSQYVDDNNIIFCINKGKPDEYGNYISQTMDITKPKPVLMRIYPLFHFIPGDPVVNTAKRRDGSMHIMNTTPDSPIANAILDESLGSANLYRIGIATHSYMDTWSHQNFSGYCDAFNSMAGLREALTPSVGHADAMHCPDIAGLVWKDRRLMAGCRGVSNKTRFLEASGKVFEKYIKYNNSKVKASELVASWNEVRAALDMAIGTEFECSEDGNDARIKRYKAIEPYMPEYCYDGWFKDAVKTNIGGFPDSWWSITILPDKHEWKANFRESDWFKFQEAVKDHQHFAEVQCQNIFQQMEIENY